MNEEFAPRCSIIIRAYNEEDHIGRLLTGIMEQTVKEVEIIVVDSGSSDATVAIASRFPTQILSIAPHEFTFGRSLNLGPCISPVPRLVGAIDGALPGCEHRLGVWKAAW